MPFRHAPDGPVAMLVTACKHCGSRFRVTPEQLNLRQGQVRCGQCDQLFNGFESLERFPGDGTGAHFLAVRAGKKPPPDPVAAIDDLDLGKRLQSDRPEPAPRFSPPIPPTPLDLLDIPDLTDAPKHEPAAAAPVESPAERRAKRPPPRGHDSPAPTLAEVKADEPYVTAPDSRPSRAWAFGVAFLALLLALQLAYAFRAELAQRYPVVRPVLESVCASAGCTVPWVNSEAALKLEDSELLEVPGKPGQIALQARIRNLSPSPQEFPHLELTLTDVTGQTAVRRVLRPADYLGRVPVTGEVMAGGSEALLSVRLETSRIRPTGYELLLFYP